ncbi:uncharacterized protein C8Q71DRAFT_856231 [Rhodofomes roseus]|uniref:PilZ domain-containing protein n=1 Tax=Rhodofomes roseus TaxID=34475 RepID=A0ABQ8KJJ0_9APHY|nr:uncharacterized protein C8Q71DRAFT_856231 [Rhodofomes roseus]KAH9838267.1 hypothetical protein C8Q71DRAFT_856231 [Rhodofomes roseus]
MPAERKKRSKRAAAESSTPTTTRSIAAKMRQPYPLPPFSLPPTNETTIDVRILPLPIVGKGIGRGLTWTLDKRPAEQLRKGMSVRFCTDVQMSGLGRLSAIADLRRHWVTFLVSGADQPCNLRVPIPWASLGDLEGYTHQHHYFNLAKLPPPHPSFAQRPAFQNEDENPYEFDIEDEEIPSLSNRIANITNAQEGK